MASNPPQKVQVGINKTTPANAETTIGGETDINLAAAGSKTALTPAQEAAATTVAAPGTQTTPFNAAEEAEMGAVAAETKTNKIQPGQTSTSTSPGVATTSAQVAATNANTAALTALLGAQNAANTAAQNANEQSALSTIEQTLASYGFSGTQLQQLVSFAWSQIQDNVPAAQVALNIQNQPAFIQTFPAISERIAAGLPPITPAEYLSDLDSYTQTLVSAGIDPTSVNLNDLVAKDVSPSELSSRIQQGYVAIAMAPQDVINAFQQYYGTTKGQLVQYFTNPSANQATLLQQATAAQIGGAAMGAGFEGANGQSTTSPISQSLALQLAQQGVTYSQAQSGFAQLASEAQLYSKLPGQGEVQTGPGGGSPYTASTSQLAESAFQGAQGGLETQQLQLQAQREENYFKQGTQLGSSGQQTAVGAYQR